MLIGKFTHGLFFFVVTITVSSEVILLKDHSIQRSKIISRDAKFIELANSKTLKISNIKRIYYTKAFQLVRVKKKADFLQSLNLPTEKEFKAELVRDKPSEIQIIIKDRFYQLPKKSFTYEKIEPKSLQKPSALSSNFTVGLGLAAPIGYYTKRYFPGIDLFFLYTLPHNIEANVSTIALYGSSQSKGIIINTNIGYVLHLNVNWVEVFAIGLGPSINLFWDNQGRPFRSLGLSVRPELRWKLTARLGLHLISNLAIQEPPILLALGLSVSYRL